LSTVTGSTARPSAPRAPRLCGPLRRAAVFDSANQAWVDATWKLLVDAPAADQNTDGIRLLSMLVMSGNWWNP
jgi:hypothetical protein